MDNNASGRIAFLFRRLGLLTGRLLVVAAIVGGGLLALHRAQASEYGCQRFQAAHLEFEGIANLNRPSIEGLVKRALGRNLILADLDHVRRVVESEPWVESATIRRILPDRVVIHIQERKPVAVAAIDEELYLVDSTGIVLDRFGARYGDLDGPIVKGLKNVALENAREDNLQRIQLYMRIVEDLSGSPQRLLQSVSEIDVSIPRRVAVIPAEEAIPVYVGDERFRERYERFLACRTIYNQLKDRYPRIEYIDVTFPDKVIFHTPGHPDIKPELGL